MPDFHCLEWHKQPIDSPVALAIRRDVREHRRERGRGGHRFSLNHVKSLWSANDGRHVVLNHVDDPAWQMWHRDNAGWSMVSWHQTRREAQAAAENDSAPPEAKITSGIYVLAGSDPERMTIRTHCTSAATADDIEAVYVKLGFTTARETVGAPVG